MRLTGTGIVVLTCLTLGCQATQLRERTNEQASTVTGLYEQEVLDDLARLYSSPDSIPYFSIAGTGINTLQRQVQASWQGGFDLITASGKYLYKYLLDKQTLQIQPTLSNSEAWQSAPMYDPDKLMLIHCIFLKTLGRCTDDCEARIKDFFGQQSPFLDVMRPGWYCVGKKRDVPKHGCCVGNCGDVYVWVSRENGAALSMLTLAILDVASAASVSTGPTIIALENEVKTLGDTIKGLLDNNNPPGEPQLKKEYDELLQHRLWALASLNHYLAKRDNLILVQTVADRMGKPSTVPTHPMLRPRINFFNPYAVSNP